MKKKSNTFHLSPFSRTFTFFTIAWLCVCVSSHNGVVNITPLEFFRRPSVRAGFSNTASFAKPIILLQDDGSVDTVKTFLFELPEGLTPADVTFRQTTTNRNVLNYPDNANLLTSFSGNVMNITSSFSFDEMAGKCDYSLSALKKSTTEVLGTVTVKFTIVGVTFYIEELAGAVFIVSGIGRRYSLPYSETIDRTVSENRKIRVFIQYPDGSSSEDFEGRPIPHVETLKSLAVDPKGVFQHDPARCGLNQLGTLTANRRLELPNACGYGFYYDSAGNLCFGIAYDPYRAGDVPFRFTWPGITADSTLSGESLEFTLLASVTGIPPVVVLRRSPNHGLLRPEGGELITLDIINSHLHNITSFHIEVFKVKKFFKMIPGSFHDSVAFPSAKNISFISEPGTGSNLTWTLAYQVDSFSSGTGGTFLEGTFTQTFKQAIYLPVPKTTFSFDEVPLTIQTMSPSLGIIEGGSIITIKGHFPFFDSDRDGIYFSGTKLDAKSIKSVSDGAIEFYSPQKNDLGDSYEYRVNVRMGNGVSNVSLFYYLVKNAAVRVSQSGTSELGNNTFRIGSCTPARFTAVVVPYTNQIRSYKWSLHLEGDEAQDLLQTEAFKSIDSTAQTLDLLPEMLTLGGYALKIVVSMLGATLETDILLLRDNVVSIGVFILKPPTRTIAYPETPLRLSAVVRTPPCHVGSQTMIFEWKAFGQTQRFSSSNATDTPQKGRHTTTPARLGWEYVVPRQDLKVGRYVASLRVWMEEDEDEVFGIAESEIVIVESPLFSVIRHGEEYMTANHRTFLNIFGSKSNDPDVFGEGKYSGLSYEWKCLQSSTNSFIPSASEACIEALLPSSSSASFEVQLNVIESLSDIKFVQYSLVVRKGEGRVSEESKLVIAVHSEGTLPHLNEYALAMTNPDGESLNLTAVPYYEQSILEVIASPDVTWTYELLEPNEVNFFSSTNLISSPLFYSLEANIFSVTGNSRPLGIDAGKLRPFTKYRFKIKFDATDKYESTEVILTIRTTEALIIGFPTPSVVEGTTVTTFTATAGIPMTTSGVSYYFVLQDSQGYEFCLGGCTGYDVIYFRIGRPGSYTITAYIFDTQGKALLDFSTLEQKIIVHQAESPADYRSELETLFANGNDPCWTQLAHELVISIFESAEAQVIVRQLEGDSKESAKAKEDQQESSMDMMKYLSGGARRIVCTARPDAYHGKDFITFAFDLSSVRSLDAAIFYDILQGVTCSIVNSPEGTMNMMQAVFPKLLEKMNGHALNLYQGGTSRDRLRSEDSSFADQWADLLLWTTSNLFKSITSGKVVGFAETKEIGPEGKDGVLSFVVASSVAHLPTRVENGNVLNVLKGSSSNEEFIPREVCRQNLFPAGERRKLYFILHCMPDFIELGHFQGEPQGSNLAEKWYVAKVFTKDQDGEFVELRPSEDDYCFCWRLPIKEMQQELNGSIEYMPGMVAVSNLKEFATRTSKDDNYFAYKTNQGKTRDYDTSAGWVEACQKSVGSIVSTTKVKKSADNAIGTNSSRVFGYNASAVWLIVVGTLLFVVAAMVCSWILAVRAMSNGEAPLAAVVPNELYVERDVYGRATIYDANAVRIGSA